MNQDRKQFIGIVLLSVLVFMLMQRTCNKQTENLKDTTTIEVTDSTKTVKTQQTDVMLAETTLNKDSVQSVQAQSTFGIFAPAANGTNETFVLENEFLRVEIESKGAQIKLVDLKNYRTFDKNALLLVNKSQEFNYTFNLSNGLVVQSKDLYFRGSQNGQKVILQAPTQNGKAVQISYSLEDAAHMLQLETDFSGVASSLVKAEIPVQWNFTALKQEELLRMEQMKSGAFWEDHEEGIDNSKIGKSSETEIEAPLKWLGFRQRFFNATLLSSNEIKDAKVNIEVDAKDSTNVANFNATFAVIATKDSMQLYYGANDYKLLNSYKNGMNNMVDLGYNFFLFKWIKYINAWLIIPMFHFLEKFISNYGIIILILTLVIKLLLMPLTFKSYVSAAKTKVLKPELEALKEQYGDDQAGYSRAQMDLYQKTGVNMFGGCLPMLLQFPFLVAMFFFFPSSIELRQESFLWAQDLSNYDTIPLLTFAHSLPIIGNHISIFAVLMTISSILMAVFNPQINSQPTQPGMEMMKYMPYVFPFFLFFLFNSFPAALTYYYFLSNMITFGQQIIINKFFIDEDKIRAQMEENKKKPVKKSSFASKMEELYKQQEQMQKNK